MYREQDFEDHIEAHLLQSGYHKRLSSEYDKDLCLIPAEALLFIQSTQPAEKAAIERIKIKLGGDDDLRNVFTGDNTREAMGNKFERVRDELILEFAFKNAEYSGSSGVSSQRRVRCGVTRATARQSALEPLHGIAGSELRELRADGRHALIAVLEAPQQMVGANRQAECETLMQQIHADYQQ